MRQYDPVRRTIFNGLMRRAIARLRPAVPPHHYPTLNEISSLARDWPAIARPTWKRALIIAPHPDDEVIGCGGTGALIAASGATVDVVIVSDGAASVARELKAGEIATRRESETRSACAVLGFAEPRFLRRQDGTLWSSVDELSETLGQVIARANPQVIFAPWLLDAHRDHMAVALAVARTEPPAGCEIWGYEVWAAAPANRLVDVTAVWEQRQAALAAHTTAAGAVDLAGHEALQRWRSIHGLGGSGHAEAFFALSIEQLRRLAAGVVTPDTLYRHGRL